MRASASSSSRPWPSAAPDDTGREDADIASALEGVFTGEGIDLALRTSGVEVTPDGDGVALRVNDGRTIRGSHSPWRSAGARTPTRSGAKPAACASIRAATSWPTVLCDERSGRVRGGDVLGGPQFTHTSWDDHRRLFDILMKPDVPRKARGARLIPYSVFTDPQVAGVGHNEKSARARRDPVPGGDDAHGRRRPLLRGRPRRPGLLKVLVDPSGDRILGASLVGAEVGELIHVFISLMQAGASPRAMVNAEFVHPTFSEGLQTLVMKLPRYALDVTRQGARAPQPRRTAARSCLAADAAEADVARRVSIICGMRAAGR